MTPPDQDLTLLGVAIGLLTAFMGPQLAVVVGTYSIILMGWLGGVLVGAYRMPPVARAWQLPAFVLVSLLCTLGVTVPLAQVTVEALHAVAPWLAQTTAKALLFPLAFALPAVGHSWADVVRWCWRQVQRRLGVAAVGGNVGGGGHGKGGRR